MVKGKNVWRGDEGKGSVCYRLVKKQRKERKGSERIATGDTSALENLKGGLEGIHAVGNGAETDSKGSYGHSDGRENYSSLLKSK